MQRLTALGDTLPKTWFLAPVPPQHTTRALLARRGQVLAAGTDFLNQPRRTKQFSLACSDTSSRVLWRTLYPSPGILSDFCTGLAALPGPRGGYLLGGSAQVGNGDIRHQLLETDSLGNLRKQVRVQPLGPRYQMVIPSEGTNEIVVLPNYGGYVVFGTADSTVAGLPSVTVGYVMRLDTALRRVWTYRQPPGLSNPIVRSQQAYCLRLLPNGTLAFLLADAGPITPQTTLVQLDLNGRLLGHYALLSNAFSNVYPYDWRWLGDGTLVLCGRANPAGGSGAWLGYLARWDMRGTPLAAARPGAGAGPGPGGVALWAAPTPAAAGAGLVLHLEGLGGQAATLVLCDALGRAVYTLPVPGGSPALALPTAGLPPGLYLARLRRGATALGQCRVLLE